MGFSASQIFHNKDSFVILLILNVIWVPYHFYLEMWGNERDWDRVEIVTLAHTPTSPYLTLSLRKVSFLKHQKPTQKPTPAWEIIFWTNATNFQINCDRFYEWFDFIFKFKMKVVQMINFSPEKNFVSSLLNFLISKSYFFLQRCGLCVGIWFVSSSYRVTGIP